MILPVGIFDSGLGGLSVAGRVLDMLPDEGIIYFADNAHVPYGERPKEDIQEFATGITGFLIKNGAKAIVMACNMSSAVALDVVAAAYPNIPILGMIEDGARAAVAASNGEPIGILATTGTVNSNAYPRAILSIDPKRSVHQQACPKFVPLVESARADSEEAEAAACTYVEPLIREGCRTIILGCTHYPFLRRAIESAAGAGVTIVDPAEEVVRALKSLLAQRNLTSSGPAPAPTYYASGETDGFATIGSAFIGRPIENVHAAEWGVDLGEIARAKHKV